MKGQKSPTILKVNKKVAVKGTVCEVDPIAKQRKLDGVKVITTFLERESPRKRGFYIRAYKKGNFAPTQKLFVTKM